MNPFDPKAALLAKHAQHVVLVHFPIALFLTGVAFDVIGRARKSAGLANAAFYNIVAAALAMPPTLATGVAAWQWQLEGQKLKGPLLLHLVLGCVSGVLVILVGRVHFRRRLAKTVDFPGYLLPLELLTAIVVALTGHVGGFLSGVNVASQVSWRVVAGGPG